MKSNVVCDGVDIDKRACATRTDLQALDRWIPTLVCAFNGRLGDDVASKPLVALTLGNGFNAVVATSGYCATLAPDATLQIDSVHADRSPGCIVGEFVDLKTCERHSAEEIQIALDRAGCMSMESRGPTWKAIATVRGKDSEPWNRGIVGTGFVGIYRQPDTNRGLFVVKTRGVSDPNSRYDALLDRRPSYKDVATSWTEMAARTASIRNAERILYELRCYLGYETRGVEDKSSVEYTSAATGIPEDGTHEGIVNALRAYPMLNARPSFVNEFDVFTYDEGKNVVRYFDGLTSVASARGSEGEMLAAIADGDPNIGMWVISSDAYVEAKRLDAGDVHSFDGGTTKIADAKWLPDACVTMSDRYVCIACNQKK